MDGATYSAQTRSAVRIQHVDLQTSMTDGIAFSTNSKFTKTPRNKDSATRDLI
jgi:hypothetical protein